jgi:hypothetical protein
MLLRFVCVCRRSCALNLGNARAMSHGSFKATFWVPCCLSGLVENHAVWSAENQSHASTVI